MSFIGSAIKSVGQAIGIIPDDPKPLPITAATTAPTVGNSGDALDAAAQTQAAAMGRGRTSTMLTGGAGTTEDQKYTSKVLLGQ